MCTYFATVRFFKNNICNSEHLSVLHPPLNVTFLTRITKCRIVKRVEADSTQCFYVPSGFPGACSSVFLCYAEFTFPSLLAA
jgi:hypothetical protein